jgi:hypothetical protein
MSLFSSLIPGIREVRAPLAAGYLWLTCAWLLLEPLAPSADENRIYGRMAEIADAVGPVGRALAVSVVAYLIGSLLQMWIRRAWVRLDKDLEAVDVDEQEQLVREIRGEGWIGKLRVRDRSRPVGTILQLADPLRRAPQKNPYLRGAPLIQAAQEIAERELIGSYRQLQVAVRSIEKTAEDEAVCDFEMNVSVPVVLLRLERDGVQGETEFVVPHFLPGRELLGQMHLLETRLLEVEEGTGAQIERLRAEMDFRLAIAPPLVALILILAVGVGSAWIFALVVPFALAMQGVDLAQRRSEELLDALRARTQTPEMERITPVFEQYRSQTTQLVRGMEEARWPSARSR